MDTSTFQWLGIVIGAFSGGLSAAVFGILHQKYRSRPQGLGTSIEASPVLPILPTDHIAMKIMLTHQTSVAEFDNLYTATIDITNLTSKDYGEFKFGVDFTRGDKAIYAIGTGKDRYHEVIPLNAPGISAPIETIDFFCKPFNRKNKYTVTVLFTIPQGSRSASDIKILVDDCFKIIDQGTFGN